MLAAFVLTEWNILTSPLLNSERGHSLYDLFPPVKTG